ncbi:hypothetical protein PENTCL1PPCAC_7161, partial [Pristionchus entomophagus]
MPEMLFSFKKGYPCEEGGPYTWEEMNNLYESGYFRPQTEITVDDGRGKEFTRTIEEMMSMNSFGSIFIRASADESEENIRRHMPITEDEKDNEKIAEEKRTAKRIAFEEIKADALSRIPHDSPHRAHLEEIIEQFNKDEHEMKRRRSQWEFRELMAAKEKDAKRKEEEERKDRKRRIGARLKGWQAETEGQKEEKEREETARREVMKIIQQQEQPGTSGISPQSTSNPAFHASHPHNISSSVPSRFNVTVPLPPPTPPFNSTVPPPFALPMMPPFAPPPHFLHPNFPFPNFGAPPHLSHPSFLPPPNFPRPPPNIPSPLMNTPLPNYPPTLGIALVPMPPPPP